MLSYNLNASKNQSLLFTYLMVIWSESKQVKLIIILINEDKKKKPCKGEYTPMEIMQRILVRVNTLHRVIFRVLLVICFMIWWYLLIESLSRNDCLFDWSASLKVWLESLKDCMIVSLEDWLVESLEDCKSDGGWKDCKTDGLVKTFSLFIADWKMNLFICLDIEQGVLI